MVRQLVIFGAGGFGREVLQVVHDINNVHPGAWELLGFLVDEAFKCESVIHGLPVLGGIGWLAENPRVAVVIGVGAPAVRRRIAEQLRNAGHGDFATLVHPRAWVGEEVRIGAGSIVCAGALLTTDISVAEHVHINIGATVGHDACLGDFVTLNPSVNVSGGVILKEGVEVGTGSVLLPKVEVGNWTIIGAGSVVTKPIPSNVTVVGAPAKVIRSRSAGWHLQ